VLGGPGLGDEVLEVEPFELGAGRDLLGGRRGDEPQVGLGLGQCGEDAEPFGEARGVLEEAVHLVCPPQMAVDSRTPHHHLCFHLEPAPGISSPAGTLYREVGMRSERGA
jgi:hypothetical protein